MGCEDCPAGYGNKGAKGCKDVDECAKDNGGCDSKRKCDNTAGSFKCGDCSTGYANDGAKGCKDVDECQTNNGGCHSARKCSNTAGSSKCEDCAAGYVNDGATGCKDIDECLKDRGGCHIRRECTNTVGSSKCEDCAAGYRTEERRAADTITRARKTMRRTRARVTTAAATLNAHAPTTGEPRNVTIAQLAMSTTERRAAKLFAELPTRYAT